MDHWCERTSTPRGELLSLEQLWKLANVWYHNRLSPEFKGRSADEAQHIFSDLGLTGPFWSMPDA